MNKEQVTALTEKLRNSAEVELYKEVYKLPQPVVIGNVLEKMNPVDKGSTQANVEMLVELNAHWQICGFSKSLQEIISESGWGEGVCVKNKWLKSERLLNPNARALFEFLNSIFNE